MSENPYQAPLSDPQKATVENPIAANSKVSIKAPAICLIVVSIISILYLLFAFVVNAILVSAPLQMDEAAIEITDHDNFELFSNVFKICCSIVANIVTLIGSINMLQFKNYRFAMVGSIVACIPCCSPCIVLGIPFGIWGLSVLNNEEIRAKFAGN